MNGPLIFYRGPKDEPYGEYLRIDRPHQVTGTFDFYIHNDFNRLIAHFALPRRCAWRLIKFLLKMLWRTR